MMRDPVCGMELDPRKASATAEHEGRLYYFCSEARLDGIGPIREGGA